MALVTISRTRCFTSQPLSMNSTASQSSSSGWLGHSPCAPKSAGVATSPVPKNIFQNRFTATRAVSGLLRMVTHCARPSRLAGAASGIGGKAAGVPGLTFVVGCE